MGAALLAQTLQSYSCFIPVQASRDSNPQTSPSEMLALGTAGRGII